MNVRLRHSVELKSAVWYDNKFRVNTYSVICDFITASDFPDDHIIALDRINYIFDTCNDSCFIHQENTKKIKALKNCDMTVIDLPQEPVDQIVGLVLFYKINAVCEDRFLCTDLDISSDLGSHIHYLHSQNEKTSAIPDVGWWHDSGPNCCSMARHTDKKVVQFPIQQTWQQLDLAWQDTISQTSSLHTLTAHD